MSTSTSTIPMPARVAEAAGDQLVVLRAIGWEGYRRLLKVRGERNVPRIVYLDGSLVYRRFQVPEVWIFEENELTILRLDARGRYSSSEHSLALPDVTAAEVHSWIIRDQEGSDTEWIEGLRRWVAEVLVPRRRLRMEKELPGLQVSGE